MKKRLTALLTLTMVFALLLTACSLGRERPTASTQAPGEQPETAAPTVEPLEVSLTDSTMSYTTWSSPNGLTVHVTATPSAHKDSHCAELIVRVGDVEELRLPCEWDGTSYTAAADLNAMNGYGYYLLISDESGASQEFTLNAPGAVSDQILVNMADALEAYCDLSVESAAIEDGTLILSNGSIVVKLPAISVSGEQVTCTEASLVLTLNDQEIGRIPLSMAEAEVSGSYEQTLKGTPFTVPELEDGHELKLRAEAALSDGQVLTASGPSWLYNGGELLASMG